MNWMVVVGRWYRDITVARAKYKHWIEKTINLFRLY